MILVRPGCIHGTTPVCASEFTTMVLWGSTLGMDAARNDYSTTTPAGRPVDDGMVMPRPQTVLIVVEGTSKGIVTNRSSVKRSHHREPVASLSSFHDCGNGIVTTA